MVVCTRLPDSCLSPTVYVTLIRASGSPCSLLFSRGPLSPHSALTAHCRMRCVLPRMENHSNRCTKHHPIVYESTLLKYSWPSIFNSWIICSVTRDTPAQPAPLQNPRRAACAIHLPILPSTQSRIWSRDFALSSLVDPDQNQRRHPLLM